MFSLSFFFLEKKDTEKRINRRESWCRWCEESVFGDRCVVAWFSSVSLDRFKDKGTGREKAGKLDAPDGASPSAPPPDITVTQDDRWGVFNLTLTILFIRPQCSTLMDHHCVAARAFLSAMFRSSFNFFLSFSFFYQRSFRVYIIGKDFYRNFFFSFRLWYLF